MKSIIANLAALSSKTCMWNFHSSMDHDSRVVRPWQLVPQSCTESSELIIWGIGEIKDLALQKIKFSLHHNSSFFASTEIAILFSKELGQINFWICWCWRWRKWRGAERTTIAVDNNLPISLLSSLNVTFSFSRISWQWFCTLRSFSLGSLKVISVEFTISLRN